MIVGTAGHIDHGKTSLVHALTGVDTDRLKEEKARGITIELGFAYRERPGGGVIGFVDVPGHERLVHTMLAGATGIDFVVLVIAADDGVMPQTREHLAILDRLGLERGLVVVTKCDLADDARRAQVRAQAEALVAGTTLAGVDVIEVSAATRQGLDKLARTLDAAHAATAQRTDAGLFRLSADRVFTLSGTGTVVTGTITSGRVGVGDTVLVGATGLSARVRSLHAHSRPAQFASAGQRCALALVGAEISTTSIRRGDVVRDPAVHEAVGRLDARLTVITDERKPVTQWMPVRLHHGAAEIPGRLVLLRDAPLASGESDDVQLVLEEPIVAAVGDRFVLRDTAATRTIAGGIILDLSPPERRRRTPERRAQHAARALADPQAALQALLACPPGWCDIDRFFNERAHAAPAAEAAIAHLDLAVLQVSGRRLAMTQEAFGQLRERVLATLEAHHTAEPQSPALPRDGLRAAFIPRLPNPVLDGLVDALVIAGAVISDRSGVRLASHKVVVAPQDLRDWARIKAGLGGETRFRPPRVRDIANSEGIAEARVRLLCRQAAKRGEVEEVAQDHYFLSETVVEMADVARALARDAPEGFTAAAFRDRLDNGRKVAIQVLEFFDRHGLTARRGEARRINPAKSLVFSHNRT